MGDEIGDPFAGVVLERAAMMAGAESPWWWLSFADGDRPAGDQFLGVAIVRGLSVGSAASTAWALGVNPGGEVMGIRIPDGVAIPDAYANRLLSRAECDEFDAAIGGDGSCSTLAELEADHA